MSALFYKAILLILIAFVPPLLYLRKVRNMEKYAREPWSTLAKVFLWGAFIATITAVILEIVLLAFAPHTLFRREYEYLADEKSLEMLILACVIAPFAEEFTKGVGVLTAKKCIKEVEDGLVYGAASGFGFAATENLLYEASALQYGLITFIFVVFVRTIASALLHGSATAMTGYGISRKIVLKRNYHVLPFYFAAVSMHALFNLCASFSLLFDNAYLPLFGLLFAIGLAGTSYKFIKKKIALLDARH